METARRPSEDSFRSPSGRQYIEAETVFDNKNHGFNLNEFNDENIKTSESKIRTGITLKILATIVFSKKEESQTN
jgi:hypothetical protein